MTKQFNMALLEAPSFSVALPVSGRKIRVRSLVNKEFKNLYIARESDEAIDVVRGVIQNAILTDGVVVEKMAMADFEKVYLEIFMASTAETIIPVRYKCSNTVDGEVCGQFVDTKVNIKETTVEDALDDVVEVNETTSIKLKTPNVGDYLEMDLETSTGQLQAVMDSIDYVEQQDHKFTPEDLGDNLSAILDMLDAVSINKLINFVMNTPRIKSNVEFTCPKCSYKHKTHIKGFENFFV